MAEYRVQFVASAVREFRALPTDMKCKVGSAIEAIGKNPCPAGVRKLHGHDQLY